MNVSGNPESKLFADHVTCVVINLDSRPDRWERVRRMCRRHGIEPIRFSALDREQGRAEFPESTVGPSELGLWASFLTVVQSEVDTDWILVLEDDAMLLPGFKRSVEKCIEGASPDVASVRVGWLGQFAWIQPVDVVRYLFRIARWVTVNATAVVRGGWSSRRQLAINQRFGTHAVLVRRIHVPRLLQVLGRAETPLDWAFVRAERSSPDVFTRWKRNTAWQRPSRSDIARDRRPKRSQGT